MSAIYTLIVTLMIGQRDCKIWEMPLPRTVQDCYNKVQFTDIQSYVGSKFSWLCESTLHKNQLTGTPQFDEQKTSYYKQLVEKTTMHHNVTEFTGWHRGKRQNGLSRCKRKEYRVLTDEERRRFHDAVNKLKQDTTVPPNKYDAIALLHETAVFMAHGGAGFAGWHRIYILMFETALREVDPMVCLPYWDTSLDSELDDPSSSSVWTSDFFGTANGPVVDGPFANWITPNGVQLIRNVGSDGELIDSSTVEGILSKTRYEDIISSSEVEPPFDLELQHGGIHVFSGGTLSQLDTAAFDPIFFLVHAYVDYIWELFRLKLKAIGVNPEEYPPVVNSDSSHHNAAPTGFGNLLQADAYRDAITNTYEYEPPPVCSSELLMCGSRFLTCFERKGRCIPITKNAALSALPELLSTPSPTLTTVPGHIPSNGVACSTADILSQPIQNDFCCDKSCDSNKWATIPVQIISVRPPRFDKYRSYPVHNGQVDIKDDIYSPSAYAQTNRYITQKLSNPKTYKRCVGDESIGQVFLSSRGINYNGFYKEAAIIDQRLAISTSMGFVAVKRPERGQVSEALLRAHDSCGRICHAACKNPLTNQYKECNGAIAISSEHPLMYGNSYDEAVMNVFDYEFNNNLPQFQTKNFFITFYCDYHSKFPYAEHSPDATPPPATVKPAPAELHASSSECFITPECTLDIPCVNISRQCRLYNEKHVCRGSCSVYAICVYGRFFLRVCPEGHYFDNSLKSCVLGACQNGVASAKTLIDNQSASNNMNVSGSSRQENMRSYHSNLMFNIVKNLHG